MGVWVASRRLTAAVAAAVVVAVGLGVAHPAEARPARDARQALPDRVTQSGPALTVEPSSGLVDGAEATFTATGLPGGSFVSVVQCPADAPTAWDEGCDTMDAAYGLATATGTFTGTMRADAVLLDNAGGEIDCRATGCILAVEGESGDTVATAPLGFAPGGPLAPPPTVSVSPADGLADLQPVSVAGAGFVWSNHVIAVQCATGLAGFDGCDYDTLLDVESDGGDVAFEYPGSVVISTYSGGDVDCRQAGACELRVTQHYGFPGAKTAVAPISFDPEAEVVPPTITVEPDTDLVDGATVRVHGEGFRPHSFVDAAVCTGEGVTESCFSLDGWVEADADGMVMLEVAVSGVVGSVTGQEVDCRAAAGTCTLVVSSGSPTSERAARAPLHFDPDAPLLPPPSIGVDPSTDLADDATVTVTGRDFTPDGYASVQQCVTDDLRRCDPAGTDADVDSDGGFTVELPVVPVLSTTEGAVDCRQESCSVVARDELRTRAASHAITFEPDAPPVDRYLDPVFDEVTVTEGVVYREVTDAAGNPLQLTLDVYEPAGDTLAERPAVVWLDDGWFSPGSFMAAAAGEGMAAYAEAFAQRGYVAVAMHYRPQPGVQCCPTRDALGITQALVDTHDDATHGVAWLREHAADFRIDPDAIAAGGAQAGAVAAYGLAYRPAESHHSGPADVAAALPIAGMSLGKPTHEGAPVLAFHGADDLTAPLHLSDWTCADAEDEGVTCDTVSYAGAYNDVATSRQRDIVRRSSEFLAEHVLEPLGYIDDDPTDPTDPPGPTDPTDPTDPPGPTDPTDPTDPPGPTDPTDPTGPPSDPGPGTSPTAPGPSAGAGTGSGTGTGSRHGSGNNSGTLPDTGSDTTPLVALGLVLAAVGAALVTGAAGWRHREALALLPARLRAARRGRHDDGRGGLPTAAVVAVVGLVLGVLAAPGHTLALQADEDGGTASASSTSSTTVTVTPGGTTVTTVADGEAGEPGGHDHPTTTGPATTVPTTMPDGPTTTMGDDPGHDHEPGEHDDHGHETTTTSTGEPHHDFPGDWTDEQVAYAEQLIADTEAALPRFANPAILPLLGYTWIFDGTTEGTYQHWINTTLIAASEIMNPEAPESLVFLNTADGPELQAAMFMLSLQYNMSNIPADIAWLPDWHVHENLCFDNNFRIVGLTVNGVCEVGFNYPTPPMVHVWTVDTPCGRFAGVDENGLQCHHEH